MFPTGKISKQTFRDRVVIVHNLNYNCVIGTAIQKSYHVATDFSVTGRHFLSVNGQMVVQRIPTPTIEPIVKNKDKIKLSPHSITIVSIKTTIKHWYKSNIQNKSQVSPTKQHDTNRCST